MRHQIAAAIVALAAAAPVHADPLAFPDIGSYAAAAVQDFTVRLPLHTHDPVNAVFFLAADGTPCNFFTGSVVCAGKPPGVPAGDRGPYTTVSTADGIHATSSTPYSGNMIQGQPINPLPAMHSVAAGGSMCGVDAAGVTACKDSQGRGFMISAQGSTWFAHV